MTIRAVPATVANPTQEYDTPADEDPGSLNGDEPPSIEEEPPDAMPVTKPAAPTRTQRPALWASIPDSHKRDAEAFAAEQGFRHEYIPTFEFENPDYVANNADRCFHCKDELFNRLEEVGAERGIPSIVYGVNKDDLGDYRPGQKAARIHQVKAPLVEAGLTKAEIRALSQMAGLSTWDRPASACLSSRIPYGTPVTAETVRTVDRGEEAVRALGFRQFRVRYHGELVRLEIASDEMSRALTAEMAAEFTRRFKALGFHYVTLDLEGYRQGAMNEVLKVKPESN